MPAQALMTVSFLGAERAQALIRGLPPAVHAALAAKAMDLAERLKAHVIDDKLSGQVLNARSGALRASIAVETTLDGDQVQVRLFSAGDVKYAAIQEYGGRTGPHDILPNKARALSFVLGGRQVFAAVVHHPGSVLPERSYLRSSLDDFASQIFDELKAAAAGAAKG